MTLNHQRPEAAQRALDGSTIDFHTMFYTIQGEGPHSGVTSLFIRLAGCNLQCPLCDTEYTQGRRHVQIDDLVRWAAASIRNKKCKLIVITGGEPTRQVLGPFIDALWAAFGLKVQIESNGVLAPDPRTIQLIIDGVVDYIVSPKTSRVCDETNLAMAFKYVIDHESVNWDDGLPIKALGHVAKPHVARPPAGFKGEIYINPMDSQDDEYNKRSMAAVRDIALQFGHRAGCQLHKLLDIA